MAGGADLEENNAYGNCHKAGTSINDSIDACDYDGVEENDSLDASSKTFKEGSNRLVILSATCLEDKKTHEGDMNV
ncbi:hypothetical protein V6N13_109525 [Hibiscus sabdariffa]